jgi:hypothetical protein
MPAVPALVFLIAAVASSFIGRALLVKTAFGVSVGWGMTVLLVPFGPLFFRLNYRELAYPTRYWRMATLPLMLLFIVNGGTTQSMQSILSFGQSTTIAAAGDTNFHLLTPSQIVAALHHTDTPAEATPAPTSAPAPAPASAPALAKAAAPAATPSVVAAPTPSKAVAAILAAMPAAPRIMSPAERVEANRKEFERLAEWYDTLKHERGYLRKGDTAAVEAYNAEAAKYQTALQLAKTEEKELAKLTAGK